MRTKVTLILLFLNVALFLFIFRFERDWRTDRVAFEVRHRVLGTEAAAVRALAVTNAAGATFRVELQGASWFLTKPLEWRANSQAVARIINDLQLLNDETSFSVRDVVKNGQSLADYGLDHPLLAVTLVSGGIETTGAPAVTTTLRIGNATKVGDRVYLLSGDGSRIHVVSRSVVDSLEQPLDHLDELRSDEVLTIPVFEARALNVQKPAAVLFSIEREGGHWSFENPIPARANKDAVELAINGLGALRVQRFVPPDSDLPPPDQLQVTIEGNSRRETLFLGPAAAPAPAAAEAEPAREYYAQLEDLSKASGRSALFTVMIPTRLLATLNAPEALRDPHVLVDLDPSAVTGIVLREPGQPDLTLQRLDQGGGWQIIPAGEGQGTQRQADPAAVRQLLMQLALLTARQFNDTPSAADLERWGFGQPLRRVSLTLQPALPTGAGPPAAFEMNLQIGRPSPRDPTAYARLEGATSVYAIDPEILDELPVSALAWRYRLVQSLPDAAVITALKLTELATNKVVLDWTPAASSALSPAQRVAAAAVADQLKQLQAARFVHAGFSEAGADENNAQPWKYKLEATVSLPGGGTVAQTSLHALWIGERTGGSEQLAGAPEFDSVFTLDQPLVDALWALTYGERDPGPPPPPAH